MPAAYAPGWTNRLGIRIGGTSTWRRCGGRPGFRLRIGGWRVIFERHEEAREIDVLRIGPRGDVY